MTTPRTPDQTTPAKIPAAAEDKPGFFKAHYIYPEKDELYGATSNDFETEADQIKDEKSLPGRPFGFWQQPTC